MGVSTRELLLILRARDEAGKVLAGLAGNITGMSKASKAAAQEHIAQGKALVTIGAGTALAGAVAVKYFVDSTTAASKYNQSAALTLTQTDKMGVSLDTIKQIGLDVARTIPVPFDEIQSGLYDIFSSMDVSVPQAKTLLTEFSKAAVAGQTDLQTAGRGTIAILNAWHLPATKVNEVNDVMFQLVRKGVGTYQDFSSAIGRAIPSTVRAGGSIQDLAGMMAFMTRNGLSTAQAATSAGRAFDAMSNPITADHMKDIGISVRDAHGEFRPMVDIIGDMNAKMKDMTGPQRAEAMRQLFLGSGGTIQARRFFDLAVPGFKQLDTLTGDMANSKGAMASAYDTMFTQPQSQVQLLTNKYKAMQVQIGEQLLPIKMKLVDAGMKLLDMWNNLSPGVQKAIIVTAAIIAVLLVLVGIVITVVGGILMLMGAAELAGVALGAVVGTVMLVIAAIVALAVIVVLIVKYHTQIWNFMKQIWGDIAAFFSDRWNAMWTTLVSYGNKIKDFFQSLWAAVSYLTTNAWNAMVSWFSKLPGRIMSGINSAVSSVRNWATNMVNGAKTAIENGWNNILNWFRGLPGRIVGSVPSPGNILQGVGQNIMRGLINGIQNMLGSLKSTLGNITNILPSWKGPPAKDAKLLFDSGKLVMKGFENGIDAQIPDIKKKLQGFTTTIPDMTGTPPSAPVVPTKSGVPDWASQKIEQTFNISTNEIDPKKHAADLGVQIAARMG